jgi:large subunit ribosomal protein L15
VNLGDLEKLTVSGTVDEKALRQAGLVNGRWDGVKVLGDGGLTKKLVLKVNAISASAREKIEKAGGSIELVPAKVHPARNSAKTARASATQA